VTDSNEEIASCYFILHVETDPPSIIDTPYTPVPGVLGDNVTLYADVYDGGSDIKNVTVNISYPDGVYGNFTMNMSENCSHDYQFVFNDTMMAGWYYYTTWVTDHANNSNYSTGCGFEVSHAIGYTFMGNHSEDITDRISGSNFTVLVNGTAESITSFIQSNLTTSPKTKCLIFDGNVLIGVTEEKTINTGDEPDWVAYNFSDPKPSLVKDTEYIIACWSNDTCNLYYDNDTSVEYGRYENLVYGDVPDPFSWESNEERIYSLYCRYSTLPEITNIDASPGFVGSGFNVTISAGIEDNSCGVDNVSVNISYPGGDSVNVSMSNIGNETFEYVFSDSWLPGQYNYRIWAVDLLGGVSNSSDYVFNVTVNATISVCTIKDTYGASEYINITDPPGDPSDIGYELLDDGSVLRIWNVFDSYYFNTSSGIQLTNHYDEYWSHNVLMLGYYNNDVWNLLYRTDELSGFNRDVDSDDETFVNATLWKDLSYGGYDFRLAIRYCLGVDDTELTVIPYIKNIDDENIPYVLGFGWELNDIQVDMTETGDYIQVGNESYYLNQTLDNSYTNISDPIYCWNNTSNETEICGYSDPVFYIMENITETTTESLYLRWDKDLTYKLQVKSRTGQYNAPVTLFVRIGTLNVEQEKYTKMFWYDASQETFYFDDYDQGDPGEAWSTNPGYMVDGSTSNFASTTTSEDIELLEGNSYSSGGAGIISKVEIRAHGYYNEGEGCRLVIRPIFSSSDGDNHYFDMAAEEPAWSSWFDVTDDTNAPSSWSWSDISSLDCDIEKGREDGTYYCSKVEIRVTFNSNSVVSNPVPADGTSNVSISPTLSINVSDADGDSIDITWYSNSSGSWISFGTNNSVGNGTYYQTFSNASVNGGWWYWKVNVSDGTVETESSVYKFYTGVQSKIVNSGSTNISGYLYMVVEYKNGSTWELDNDTINETTPRTINASDTLALDLIFNGLVDTSDLTNGDGTYRVYAAFRDPDGDVLVCDDESLLEAWWEFEVDTS
jgi:hypothetical protein